MDRWYKQPGIDALILYAERRGVTNAGIRYHTNRQYIYRWRMPPVQSSALFLQCSRHIIIVPLK